MLFTQDKMKNKYSYHFIFFLPSSFLPFLLLLPSKMIYLEMYRVSTPCHCPDECLSSEVAWGTLINDRSGAPLSPFYQSGGMHVACSFAFLFFSCLLPLPTTPSERKSGLKSWDLLGPHPNGQRNICPFGPRLQACKLLFKA